jgi:hypothetical protein
MNGEVTYERQREGGRERKREREHFYLSFSSLVQTSEKIAKLISATSWKLDTLATTKSCAMNSRKKDFQF